MPNKRNVISQWCNSYGDCCVSNVRDAADSTLHSLSDRQFLSLHYVQALNCFQPHLPYLARINIQHGYSSIRFLKSHPARC